MTDQRMTTRPELIAAVEGLCIADHAAEIYEAIVTWQAVKGIDIAVTAEVKRFKAYTHGLQNGGRVTFECTAFGETATRLSISSASRMDRQFNEVAVSELTGDAVRTTKRRDCNKPAQPLCDFVIDILDAAHEQLTEQFSNSARYAALEKALTDAGVDFDHTRWSRLDRAVIKRDGYRLVLSPSEDGKLYDCEVEFTNADDDIALADMVRIIDELQAMGFDGKMNYADRLVIDPQVLELAAAVALVAEPPQDNPQPTLPGTYYAIPSSDRNSNEALHFIHSDDVPRTDACVEDQCIMPPCEAAAIVPAGALVQMPYAWGFAQGDVGRDGVELSVQIDRDMTVCEANGVLLDFYRFVMGQMMHTPRDCYVLEVVTQRDDANPGATVYRFHHGT